MTRLLLAAQILLFATPVPRSDLSFPRDHGAHREAPVEWWYYTGHLQDGAGRERGFQLTFFRVREVSLAHFAWSDVAARRFTYQEKMHLELPGIAGAASGRLSVFNEDWSAEEVAGATRLHAAGRDWDFSLSLKPQKPPVANGEGGLFRKGPGKDEYSHYVSSTRLSAAGRMRRGKVEEKLTGTAWFDHEWTPGVLPAGWDWFALQMDDGSELMLYRNRARDGKPNDFSSGTFIPASGPPRPIAWQDVRLSETGSWTSPHSGGRYPSGWRISVHSLGLDVAVLPQIPDQELTTERSTGVRYWEGTCSVAGTRQGKPIAGRAYAELTGYAGEVPGSFGF